MAFQGARVTQDVLDQIRGVKRKTFLEKMQEFIKNRLPNRATYRDDILDLIDDE